MVNFCVQESVLCKKPFVKTKSNGKGIWEGGVIPTT